jgi:peptide/nickel transport system permease protein
VRTFFVRRLVQAGVIVVLVASITFFLIHAAPGDPFATTLDNPLATEALRERLRAQFGLDRPLAEQYVRYLSSVARGELGYSFSLRRPVGEAVATFLPNTLLLMAVSLAGSFTLGVAVGVLQAVRHGRATDRALSVVSLVFYSMPEFWFALMAILLFAYELRLFPVGGMVDPVLHQYLGFWARVGDRLMHLVLPATTLALLSAAAIARYQRSAMLDVIHLDFVRTARAKGLRLRAVVLRHALRNALLPTITLLGLAFPALLGGAVFIEKIFSWPGMGQMAVNAVATRDYPLVTASVILGAVMVAAGNILADLLSAAIDPRLRA